MIPLSQFLLKRDANQALEPSLVDPICGTPRLIISGFKKLYRFIFVRKTPPQGTTDVQQTTPGKQGHIQTKYFQVTN
jgi:hypothetical protein